MPRWFNTAGANQPELHYTLPAIRRLPGVHKLIDQRLYFVLHAPRQVGKTTALRSLAKQLTEQGRHLAVLLSMEVGAAFRDDPGAAELAILSTWRQALTTLLPADLQPPAWPDAPAGSRIGNALSIWAAAAPRPLVVFLDEIDALWDNVLISVLRQLRSGYDLRPNGFPSSLAIVGLRDVRDYKVAAGGDVERLGTSSPFNIKAESMTLSNFTADEVAQLYAQHTAETGQAFSTEAIERAFSLTQGQPWLVNALARQLTEALVPDRNETITVDDVERARDTLIERQDTHLDSLAERLQDPRVRAIIEPMLAGQPLGNMPADDIRFVRDLGLVQFSDSGGLEVANPIYRQIIVQALTYSRRASLPHIPATWLTESGQLDSDALLAAFLKFWRQHGEPLLAGAPYHEVAPHLVLMAFLDRVANGGGSVEREYAIGRGRLDLCLRYKESIVAIEIKVWRQGRPDPLAEGLQQIDGYLAGLGVFGGKAADH